MCRDEGLAVLDLADLDLDGGFGLVVGSEGGHKKLEEKHSLIDREEGGQTFPYTCRPFCGSWRAS